MSKVAIYSFATWRIKAGQMNTVLALLEDLAKQSLLEEGNLFYKIYQSNADANTIILFEGYTDDTALKQHRDSDHYRTIVGSKIKPLLEDRQVVVATEFMF